MFAIRKFILYSTILMIFSDRAYVTVGVHLYAFYLVIFFNLFLLWQANSLWIPKGLLFFIGYIFLSGVFGLAIGSNSIVGFAKDFLGIVPNAIYLCSFMRFMNFDYERCFALYAKASYFVALLGIAIYPLQVSTGGRLTSVLGEPATFCLICFPALYYYADSWLDTRKHGWRFFVLFVAFILTYSSLGYMGMLFGIYMLGTRYRFGSLLAPALIVLAGVGIYSQSKDFQIRLDDTLRSLTSADLSGVNLSSYGVVANIFVTEKAFMAHPLIGGGLGSYVASHDLFANQLIGMAEFQIMGMGELSRWDASSLLLRVTAEFGLIGLGLSIWFLWRFWPRKSTASRRAIANAILCYVFMKIVRSGAYFNPEVFFFFVGYVVNGIMANHEQPNASVLLKTSQVIASRPPERFPVVKPV